MKKTTSRTAPAHYYHWYNGTDLHRVELYKKIHDTVHRHVSHPIIYDLGCGQGHVTDYLGAIGFDINKHAISMARAKYPKTRFNELDITKLDRKALRLPRAHAIVCLNVIEHIPDKKRNHFMANIIPNFLRSDGVILFSLQRQYFLPNWINSLVQRGMFFDPTHVENWTIEEFKKQISRFYRIEKCIHVSGFTKFPHILRFLKSETLIVAKL